MRFLAVFLISTVCIVGLGISQDVDGKSSKFQETLNCQPSSDCSSTFTISKGATAKLTISVETQEDIEFKVENPNGNNVRLGRAAFPDTQGMTQVFTRTVTADIGGDYTLTFLKPIPQNFEAIVTATIEDSIVTDIRDIPAASQPRFEGGCLIATATYDSELASQVQKLREIRDNSLLVTKSGTSFMNSFNQFYYSFSPYIADYERQNPFFKEMIKFGITPLISSLSILNYVEMNSEESVLGIGISLILLNVGMYIAAPAAIIVTIKKGI